MKPVFEDAFFKRPPSAPYSERRCAYLVIRNDEGKFAFVDVGGSLFLVGGGIDEGESPEDALVREAREEIGAIVTIKQKIGDADDYVFGKRENAWVRKQCTFYEGVVEAIQYVPQEQDHLLGWYLPHEARPIARQQSFLWAIDQVAGRDIKKQ